MPPLRLCLSGLLCSVAMMCRAEPPRRDWKVPPVDGELAGEFSVPLLDRASKLNWKLTVRTEKPGERALEFKVEGEGARVHGEARVDPAGDGTWRITGAEINLTEWFRVAPLFAPTIAAVSVGGTLTLTGNGTWRNGVFGGSASVGLRDGRVDDPQHKLLLEGIAFDVDFVDIETLRTAPAQVFTWRSGRYDVVPLGVGRIEFQLDRETVRVTSALIDVFGGELQVGSLVMSMTTPEFSADARMVGVALDQLLFLLPPVLSEARGRLDGELALSRDESGIQIGAGNLSLRPDETALLRLAPSPGLISGSLPGTVIEHYPGLGKIETGEVPLRAETLEVTFTPEGDAKGRTAWVHVAGGPIDPKLRAPIDLTVNVRGPLQSLIKFGTNSRLGFGGEDK